MGESLLEEYLEGAKRFNDEVSFNGVGVEELRVQGAIFDRDLSSDELEAVMELAVIGIEEPVEHE